MTRHAKVTTNDERAASIVHCSSQDVADARIIARLDPALCAEVKAGRVTLEEARKRLGLDGLSGPNGLDEGFDLNAMLEDLSEGFVGSWFEGRGVLPGASHGARLNRGSQKIADLVMRAFEENGTPQTVRQLFYQVEAHGGAPKSQAGYRQVQRVVLTMRRNGMLPYDHVADSTRWMRKPTSFGSLEACLENTKRTYRRDLWASQPAYVEVWIEKDALAGVLYEVTSEWDVPLMSARGFASESFLFTAAEAIREANAHGKAAHIFYLGDYDAAGQDAMNFARKALERFGARFEFDCLAVTAEQIAEYNLPTRPAKTRRDPDACVELDALPANALRTIVRQAIEGQIDSRPLQALQKAEKAEKETLDGVLAGLFGTSTTLAEVPA